MTAKAFLDSLADYERLAGYRYDEKEFNLARMRGYLAALGRPDAGLPAVLIAGTKGKGSTAAMLEAILRKAGRRTGLYTSPHLVSYRERIKVDGRDAGEEEFERLAARAREAAAGLAFRPMTFEALTAMALLAFHDARVEVAVLEVGLGGRLDATNAVGRDVACVTPVSLDHMDQLGTTIPEIAREKAGIITTSAPVVLGAQEAAAARVLEEAAAAAGAPLWRAGTELIAEGVRIGEDGTAFDAATPAGPFAGLRTPLIGRFQAGNALVAVGAGLRLPAGLRPDEAAIRAGLAAARWPCRLERWSRDPRVWLDGAHNAASGAALAETVRELWPGRRIVLVLGMLKGKDHAGTARALCPAAERVLAVAPRHPRALPAEELARIAAPFAGRVSAMAGGAAALAAALDAAGRDGLVLVAGSLALAGELQAMP